MRLGWLIDTLIAERNEIDTGFPTLAEAAREAGYAVCETKYVPFSDGIDRAALAPLDGCTHILSYGCHEFIRQVRRAASGPLSAAGAQFLDYCREPQLAYSGFSPHLGRYMLNKDFVLLPYAELRRRNLPDGTWFIRPDKVTKEFTGRTISRDDASHELNALNQIERVAAESLIVMATAKPIQGEFRFVIADGHVVAGSEYRWDGKLDIRRDCPPAAVTMAVEIALQPWQADSVYVCDIAIDEKGDGRLLELNAFSCSGLYACDTRRIVDAVGKSIKAEMEV